MYEYFDGALLKICFHAWPVWYNNNKKNTWMCINDTSADFKILLFSVLSLAVRGTFVRSGAINRRLCAAAHKSEAGHFWQNF